MPEGSGQGESLRRGWPVLANDDEGVRMAGTRAQCLKADVWRFPDDGCDLAIDSQPGFAVGCDLPADGARLFITDDPGEGGYARAVAACDRTQLLDCVSVRRECSLQIAR